MGQALVSYTRNRILTIAPSPRYYGRDSGEIKDFATQSFASVSKIPPLGANGWEKVVPSPVRDRGSGFGGAGEDEVLNLCSPETPSFSSESRLKQFNFS